MVKTIHFKDLLDSNGGLIVLAQEGEKYKENAAETYRDNPAYEDSVSHD